MALPRITSRDLGTPSNFVGPALNAFLATSQDLRAENNAASIERQRNQASGLASRASNRADALATNTLATGAVNRNIAIQELSIRLDEAEFKKQLQPLELEKRRLDLDVKKFNLNLATQEFRAEGVRRKKFEEELDQIDSILKGDIDPRQKVDKITEGTVYWDNKNNRPLLTINDADGKARLTDKSGDVQDVDISNLTKVKSVNLDEISSSSDVLSEAEKTGNPEFDKIRTKNHRLDAAISTQQGQLKPNKNMLRALFARKEILSLDHRFQLMQAEGTLDLPEDRERKDARKLENLKGLISTVMDDADANSFISNNPKRLKSLSNLDAKIQLQIIQGMIEQKNKVPKETTEEKLAKSLQFKINTQSIIFRNLQLSGASEEALIDAGNKKASFEAELEALKMQGGVNIPQGSSTPQTATRKTAGGFLNSIIKGK